ncbi:MAG: adenosine deaminase [Planctomycetes bacterium RBG_16_59_8]|nr:MAG: adenosine deaminase [Planctomycetes bacterium RBG_16_59_8]
MQQTDRHTLHRLLKALPKVDLHRHLEGSIRPETILELAVAQGVNLPTYDLGALRQLVQIGEERPGFSAFLEKFRLIREIWVSLDAVERVAAEAVADAAGDHVRYLELRYSPRHFARKAGFSIEAVCERVTRGARRAASESGMIVNFIATLGRDFGVAANASSAEYAIAHAGDLFVGLDLAGDETRFPAEPFLPLFERAKSAGLGITIHAGEAAGAENVREALELFHAQRIGHGIRAIDDERTLALARERNATFEICLTSNIHTSVVKDLRDHPIKKLLAAACAVTLNTDDPAISNMIDLTHEYSVALSDVGLTLADLRRIILAGLDAAFLPAGEKRRLREELEREIDAHIAEYLPPEPA